MFLFNFLKGEVYNGKTISKRFYQKNKSPKDLSYQISKNYLPEKKYQYFVLI
jgi:cytochrome c oxidase assembly protein Cox11